MMTMVMKLLPEEFRIKKYKIHACIIYEKFGGNSTVLVSLHADDSLFVGAKSRIKDCLLICASNLILWLVAKLTSA